MCPFEGAALEATLRIVRAAEMGMEGGSLCRLP